MLYVQFVHSMNPSLHTVHTAQGWQGMEEVIFQEKTTLRENFAYLHGKFIYDTASQLAEEKALYGPCQNGRFRYSLCALYQNLLFLFTSFVYLFLFFRQQVRTLILWKIAVSCLDFLFFVYILCIKVMVWKLQPLNKAILHVLPVIQIQFPVCPLGV